MKKINRYEIVDHGVDGSQYFQGCGVSFTDFDYVVTGSGNSYKEALDDAMNQLADSDYDVESSNLPVDLDNASEVDLVAQILLEQAPSVEYQVKHLSYCGMWTIDEKFESKEDARQFVADLLKSRRKEFPVATLTHGEMWEVQEPEDCVMIPDQCGTIKLSDNSDEVEKEIDSINENSDLFYYISIRVKDES